MKQITQLIISVVAMLAALILTVSVFENGRMPHSREPSRSIASIEGARVVSDNVPERTVGVSSVNTYTLTINQWKNFVQSSASLVRTEAAMNTAVGCDYESSALCILLTLTNTDLSSVSQTEAQRYTEFAWKDAARNSEAYTSLLSGYLNQNDPRMDFVRPTLLKELSMLQLSTNENAARETAQQIPSDQLMIMRKTRR